MGYEWMSPQRARSSSTVSVRQTTNVVMNGWKLEEVYNSTYAWSTQNGGSLPKIICKFSAILTLDPLATTGFNTISSEKNTA